MRWLALPFSDTETREILDQIFDANGIPTPVILDKEGRTVSAEGVDVIEEYGVKLYPFTAERFDELKAEAEAIRAAQTAESLLASDERDFVVAPGGKKEDFEIVFISSDKDQKAFEDYHGSMPWLALPLGDKVKKNFNHIFSVKGIPTLIVIGPDGKTVTTGARNIISSHGAKAYPFTDSRLQDLEKEIEESPEKWLKEVTHSLHGHSLELTHTQVYTYDGRDENGNGWSFRCKKCDFDLHPGCALDDEQTVGKEQNQQEEEENQQETEAAHEDNKPAGVRCDGDVCYRV